MLWLAAVLALAALLVQRRNVSRASDEPPAVPPAPGDNIIGGAEFRHYFGSSDGFLSMKQSLTIALDTTIKGGRILSTAVEFNGDSVRVNRNGSYQIECHVRAGFVTHKKTFTGVLKTGDSVKMVEAKLEIPFLDFGITGLESIVLVAL